MNYAFRSRVSATTLVSMLLVSCGGGGGGDSGPPPSRDVTINGRIQFQQPRSSENDPNTNYLLNNVALVGVGGAAVEIIDDATGSVITSTRTNADGNYNVVVVNGRDRVVRVRAKAQMVEPASATRVGYDVEVRDNTQGSALYVLDSPAQTLNAGARSVDVTAFINFTGSPGSGGSYTGPQNAAPFAVLHGIRLALETIASREPNRTLPALDVFWSDDNTIDPPLASSCGIDPTTGEIGSSFYVPVELESTDLCPAVPAGIYLLGDFTTDADQFDLSVVAHEACHFLEQGLARSDSMGGPHSLNDFLDPRIAYSEGFCNGYSSVAKNSPFYFDGRPPIGAFINESFNYDGVPFTDPRLAGFYNEATMSRLVWEIFDPVGPAGTRDQVSLGVGPIHWALTRRVKDTDAMATPYVFLEGVLDAVGRGTADGAGVRALAQSERIFGDGDYGNGETGAPLNFESIVLPVYLTLQSGVSQQVISTSNLRNQFTSTRLLAYNKLGARRLFILDMPAAGSVRIRLQGLVYGDPDFYLYRKGEAVCEGTSNSKGTGLEDKVCTDLQAGRHILEVHECTYLGSICTPRDPLMPNTVTLTVTATLQ